LPTFFGQFVASVQLSNRGHSPGTQRFFSLVVGPRAFVPPQLRPNTKSKFKLAVSIQPQTFYVCLKSGKDTPCLNQKNLRQNARVQTLFRSPLGIKRSTTLLDSMVSGQPRQARRHKTNPHKPAGCGFLII
jgi:hypothetical protein